MSDRIVEIFLFDILIAVTKIEIASGTYSTVEELQHNFMAWDTLMREYEVIGEAVNVLMKNDKLDSSYRPIVDFRNKIIHHYFGIDPDAVWDITQNYLPILKQDIASAFFALSAEIKVEIENEANEVLNMTPEILSNLQKYLRSYND